MMDKLWAPWRINYIRGKRPKGCIFCRRKDYLLFKTPHAIAMLNIFPYNNGHIMVAPLRHVARLDKLRDEEALDLFRAVKRAQALLDKVVKPEGYNLGINSGKIAGAGFPGHLHIHIVPRWAGDTNFMPTVFATKIISESLDSLYRKLQDAQSKTA
ncbi:MAG: HIT domain-containing protein [Candidatus Omnitrophota bacterium]